VLRKEKRRRRRVRAALIALGSLVLILGIGIGVLRAKFYGESLAELVERQMNDRIRGKVEIGSIEWKLSDLPAVITGGFIEVTIHDLMVYDGEDPRERVLYAKKAVATIDAHPAILGRHDLIVSSLVIEDGEALIREVTDPYPVHEYDKTTVSLVSAFYPQKVPAFRAGISAGSSALIDLVDFEVKNADLTFRFGGFEAVVEDAHVTHGFLRSDGSDPLAPTLYYSLAPTAKSGTIKVGPMEIDLDKVDVVKLAQLPMKWPHSSAPTGFQYMARATTTDGALVDVDGKINRDWLAIYGGEHDTTVTITKAGGLAKRLSKGLAHGDTMSVTVEMQGPAIAPRFSVHVKDVGLTLATPPVGPPLELELQEAIARFDMATNSGTLEKAVATGVGGKVELEASLNLKPTGFSVGVEITDDLELRDYLPLQVRKLAGSALRGKLRATGDWQTQKLEQLDLHLGRAHLTGQAYREDRVVIDEKTGAETRVQKIHADGVHLALGKTSVRQIRGAINTAARRLENITFQIESADLAAWLPKLGAPALARGASGSGRVSGSFADPQASAELTLRGVPVVSRVDTDLRYGSGTLEIERAHSSALGGTLDASGKLLLGHGRPQLSDVQAHGRDLDLSALPGATGFVKGTMSIDASASGSAAAPDARAVARVHGLELAGDSYADTELVLESDPDGRRSARFELVRQAGGVLSANASLGRHGELGGSVNLRKLPLESLTALGGKGVTPVGGRIDAELALSGTVARPTADGKVQIARGWFRDTFLGSAQLDVERVGDGQLRITGELFQGTVEVDGTINTHAPFRADMTLAFHRAELDHLFPELAEQQGARGWVSGEVTWKGALSMAPGLRPEITANLTEAVVMFDREDASGRPAPFRLANKTPLSVVFDGQELRFLQPVVLHGPAGDFTLGGKGSLEDLGFELHGKVAVAMMAPYLKRYFDDMSGSLDVAVKLRGSAEDPKVSGIVEVTKVVLKPIGQDSLVRIPTGKVEFTNSQVSVTGLSMVVVDEYNDGERSELRVAGGIKLRNFVPVNWGLQIDGELSGKMLLVVAPAIFSAASGSADVSVGLVGEGLAPDIEGEITFSDETPLTITPRGVRREIAFRGGGAQFTENLIELEDSEGNHLSGMIDDEGVLSDISGEISLVNWKPVDVDVTITAEDLPFRIPSTLELAVNVRDLHVVGGMDEGLEIEGGIEIVDGRYIRKFRPYISALRPERSNESGKPVFEAIPLLGNARLNLLVETRAFFVKNNVADIEMAGQVTVRGTPMRPTFAGDIRVEQGSFKFEGMRAKFEQTRGTVSFSPYKQFPDYTPTLDIRSESNYKDIGGQAHLITLILRGPIGQLDWDLSTSTGLNRAQTLALIVAGRSLDQARTALSDEPIGDTGGDRAPSTTTQQGGGVVIADQMLKQLAGDYFSLLVEDSIKGVTNLDVVRLQLGTQSLGVHLEKQIVPSLTGVLDAERALTGWSWDARGEYRLNDSVTADGGVNAKRFDDEAEEDVTDKRVRLLWRKVLLP
jgi:autotransporter translocation and assembly factor TamB